MAKKKKKRNLNIPFLIVVVLVACGIIGGTIYILLKKQESKNVAVYKENARVAIEQKNWQEAYDWLTLDPHHMGRDPEAMMWLYDVSMHLSSFDKDKFDMARRALFTVVQITPNSLPAHRAQLKFMRDYAKLVTPNADLLTSIEDVAKQTLVIAPDYLPAIEAMAYVKTQRMKLASSTADSGDFRLVADDLAKQVEAHPESTEIAFAHLSSLVGEATAIRRELVSYETPPELKALLDGIEEELNKQLARAADPKTSSADRTLIYSKALEVYSSLAELWSQDEGQRKKYNLRASEMLPKIIDAGNPEDEDFERIVGAAGAWSEIIGNIPQAERAYRKVLEGRPESWTGRLSLANLLYRRQGGLDSAIELLEVDLPPSTKLYGLQGRIFFDQTVDAQLQRAFLRTQKLPQLKEDQRKALRALIESDLSKATAQSSESDARALRVRGSLAAMDGDYSTSMQLFAKALERIPASSLDPRIIDLRNQIKLQQYTVMYAAGETGSARSLLEEVLKSNNSPILRLQLAELFIREQRLDDAREQVEEVLKVDPDNVTARALLPQLYTDPKAREEAFSKLPEDTPDTRLSKLNAAFRSGKADEIVRLGELVRKDHPDDIQIATVLSDFYLKINRKDDAIRTIKEVLALNPDNEELKLRLRIFTASTAEQKEGLIGEALDQIKNPVQRLLVEAQLALREGDEEKYLKLLNDAAELDDKTANPVGMAAERLFAYYTERGLKDPAEFEKAAHWVDRLGKYNADQAGGRIYQGRLLLAQSTPEKPRQDEVIAMARAMITENPDFAQPWILLAIAQRDKGQFIDALSSFNEALKKQPDNLEAIRGAVMLNEQLNRNAEARPLVERGLGIDPSDPYLLDKKLSFDLEYGDPAPVIKMREEAVKRYPNNAQNRLRLAQAYESVARRYHAAGKVDRAKEEWAKSRDTYASAMKDFQGRLEFVDGYARMSGNAGDYEAGVTIYTAMRARPEVAGDPAFTLRFAEYLTLGGRYDQAIALLDDYLKTQKDLPEIRLRLAQLYVAARRPDDAAKLLEGRTEPLLAGARLDLLITTGKLAEATAEAKSLLESNRTPETLRQAANIALRSNNPETAIEYLDESLKADPGNIQSLYLRALARSTMPSASLDEVIADLEKVKFTDPRAVEARLLLADTYRRSARFTDWMTELDSTARDNPSSKRAVTAAIDAYADANPPRWGDVKRVLDAALAEPALSNDFELLFTQAKLFIQQGQAERALDAAKRARVLSNDAPGALIFYFELLNQLGKHQLALTETEPFIKTDDPNSYWAHNTRGMAYAKLGNQAEAANEFQKAFELANSIPDDKRSNEALAQVITVQANAIGVDKAYEAIKPKIEKDRIWSFFAAELLKNKQDYSGALKLYEKTLASPGITENERINIYQSAGPLYLLTVPPEPAKAVEMFRKWVELRPDSIMANNNLSYALTLPDGGGTVEEAIVYSERAYKEMQKQGAMDAYIMDTHGWNLINGNQVEDGIDVLQNALVIKKLPEIYYHLGEGYLRVNRPDEAVLQLKNALALIRAARQNGAAVDPELENRVQECLGRAQSSIQ